MKKGDWLVCVTDDFKSYTKGKKYQLLRDVNGTVLEIENEFDVNQTKNNKLIVVLGMHRSGTSAISAGMQVLGVEFGDRLLPPVKGDNDKGYWEDIDLCALNVKCLKFK